MLVAIAFILLRRRRSTYDDDDVLSPPNKSTRPTQQEQLFLALGASAPSTQQQPSSSTSPPVFSPVGSRLSQSNPYFQQSRVSPPKYPSDGFVSNAQRLSSPPFHAAAAAQGYHFDSESICDSAASGNSHNLWVSAMESNRTDSAVNHEPVAHQDSTNSLWDDDDSNARASSSSYDRGDSFLSGSNFGSFNNNSDRMGDESPFEYGTPAPPALSRNNSITL
ncbi:hypothetical protein DYB32_005637 [Aphanomyces invadans]|nr:hypothetical protein DYB32_005637 [Aphanomyces invadans]